MIKVLTTTPDVNTEIDNLKATVVKMIKAGIPVFFGCDVGKHSNSTLGVMDLKLFDYEARIVLPVIRANADDVIIDRLQHQTRFDEETASSSSRDSHDTCDGHLWCARRS